MAQTRDHKAFETVRGCPIARKRCPHKIVKKIDSSFIVRTALTHLTIPSCRHTI